MYVPRRKLARGRGVYGRAMGWRAFSGDANGNCRRDRPGMHNFGEVPETCCPTGGASFWKGTWTSDNLLLEHRGFTASCNPGSSATQNILASTGTGHEELFAMFSSQCLNDLLSQTASPIQVPLSTVTLTPAPPRARGPTVPNGGTNAARHLTSPSSAEMPLNGKSAQLPPCKPQRACSSQSTGASARVKVNRKIIENLSLPPAVLS